MSPVRTVTRISPTQGSPISRRAAPGRYAERLGVLLALSVLGLMAAAQGLSAQVSRTQQTQAAPELEGPRVDLAEAVARTLRNSPALADAEQAVVERQGVAQETLGLFDPFLFFDTNFQMRQQELLSQQIGGEIRRRFPLELAAGCEPPTCDPAFIGLLDEAADGIARGAFTTGSVLFAECSDTDSLLVFSIQGGRDVTLCLDGNGDLRSIQLIADVSGQLLTSSQLATLARVQAILNILEFDLDGQIDNLLSELQDEVREIVRQLRITAAIFRLQRANVGTIPEVEQFLELTAEVGNRWQFRNGMAFTASVALLGREDNYADKRLEIAFGDTTVPNTFSVTPGLTLDIPLAAGRGRLATSGTSRAAETALRAQQAVYRHTAAGEALRTIANYWILAAAEEKVGVLGGSVETQSRILDATRTLVEADEIAAVEANRTEARYAQTAGQLASARLDVTRARADLASSMGESPASLAQTPLAAEELPPGPGEPYDPGAWIDRALQQRDDLEASALATQATSILEEVARTDLRRRVDLSLNTSYNAFEEGFVNRIYELDGYWEALTGGIVGPSYGFVLRFDLPFQNRTAKGRLAQARSNTSNSRINEADLERQIRLQLTDLVSALEDRRAQLAQVEELVRQTERALQASNDLYDAGELTLIDLLTTEEQVTSARLALVDLRAEIAILEAQIRFEAGELLEPAGPDQDADYRSLRLRPREGAQG